MRSGRSWSRRGAEALLLAAVVASSFAAARSTVAAPGAPDPVRLEGGIPVGVVQTPAGALAAADNFVAAGVPASLDPERFREFANAVIEPGAHDWIQTAGAAAALNGGPPAGAQVIGSVVADRLDAYGSGRAEVGIWALGTYWDGGSAPTQYWSLVEVSLRWSGDRWRMVAARESVPGPVPALIAGGLGQRTSSVWDRVLAGMSAPYYGDR